MALLFPPLSVLLLLLLLLLLLPCGFTKFSKCPSTNLYVFVSQKNILKLPLHKFVHMCFSWGFHKFLELPLHKFVCVLPRVFTKFSNLHVFFRFVSFRSHKFSKCSFGKTASPALHAQGLLTRLRFSVRNNAHFHLKNGPLHSSID